MSVLLIISLIGCQNNSSHLTMEKLEGLSKQGEDLSWQDFQNYDNEDVGSGLYILKYDINEDYYLLIGGGNKHEKPMYIRLVKALDNEKYIDIRTDSISDFIS